MSSDKPSLTELLSKAGLSESLSDSEWKSLSQKLNNLDKVASRTEGPGLEPAGVRWRGQYKFYVDWDNNGNYTGTYDNLTSRFVSADIRRGLPGPETFCAIPGMIEIVLDNTDGMLTSTNSSSPIQAQITSSAKKRCKLTCTANGTEYQLFDGWVKEIAANPDTHGRKMATVVVDDLIGRMKNIPMISSMVKSTTELTMVAQALAGVVPAYYGKAYYGGAYYGYSGAASDIDPVYGSAQDLFGYGGDSWRESETSVLDAVQDTMSSCLGHFYVSRTGVPTYVNRLYRPQNASVTDWDASKVSRIDAIGLFDETLFTEVQLIIQQRKEGTTASVLWTLRDQPTVPANGSLTYIANFTDSDGGSACGCIYPVTPVRGTDFTNNVNLSVAVAWRGADALVTVTNSSGAGIALTLLQLRGTPVIRLDEMQIKQTGSTVPKKTLWHSAPLLTDTTDAQSYVEWLYTVVSFLTDRPRQATIVPDSPATLAEVCQLDIDRRIKLVDGSTSFVNWVRHTITPGNHKVEVGTSPAISTTMWTLGLSELGTTTALGV